MHSQKGKMPLLFENRAHDVLLMHLTASTKWLSHQLEWEGCSQIQTGDVTDLHITGYQQIQSLKNQSKVLSGGEYR